MRNCDLEAVQILSTEEPIHEDVSTLRPLVAFSLCRWRCSLCAGGGVLAGEAGGSDPEDGGGIITGADGGSDPATEDGGGVLTGAAGGSDPAGENSGGVRADSGVEEKVASEAAVEILQMRRGRRSRGLGRLDWRTSDLVVPWWR